MTTEDYVSFETAKLLKEKGFYGECLSMYLTPKPHFGMGNPNEAKIAPHGRDSHYYEGYEYQCEAPTLQMAMKWLREAHKIAINIGWGEAFEENYQWWCIILNQNSGEILRESEYSKTYEEAAEAAIRYCLYNLGK